MNEALVLQEELKSAYQELRDLTMSLPHNQAEKCWEIMRMVYESQLIGKSLEMEIDALRRLAGLDPPKK